MLDNDYAIPYEERQTRKSTNKIRRVRNFRFASNASDIVSRKGVTAF